MYDLTICIPTYNKANRVEKLVNDILSIECQNVEIVVLDNGSTDDTLNRLSKFRDPRFKLASNGENKGALFNMLNVLDMATGRYAVYCTDQDNINVDLVVDFKDYINNVHNLAAGYCRFESEKPLLQPNVYDKGLESLKDFAYLGRHPTGYFFNNELLKGLNITERFSDYDIVDLFPLEFVFAELSLMGKCAVYHIPVFSPERSDLIRKNKSSTTIGMSDRSYFHPSSRLKMAINYSRHVNALDISFRAKRSVLNKVFYRGLYSSTIGLKAILNDDAICEHYYLSKSSVSIFKMSKFASIYCLKYLYNLIIMPNVPLKHKLLNMGSIFYHIVKKIVLGKKYD